MDDFDKSESKTREPISVRLYGGILVIGILGFIGFIINLFLVNYIVIGKIVCPIILIPLLLLTYNWLSIYIYQMSRKHAFVIDFGYALNQNLDGTTSGNIPWSMELKAEMYPPTARIIGRGTCTTPNNLPEPLLEIEKNKYKENRLRNRKKLALNQSSSPSSTIKR